MRSDCRDFSATFRTAGMLKPPATTTTTMRASQILRFDEAAVVIGIPLSGLPEELGFLTRKLTNKPEIYMKAANPVPARRSGDSSNSAPRQWNEASWWRRRDAGATKNFKPFLCANP